MKGELGTKSSMCASSSDLAFCLVPVASRHFFEHVSEESENAYSLIEPWESADEPIWPAVLAAGFQPS